MYGKIKEHLQNELAEIKAAGLYKTERIIESHQKAEIDVAGKKVLNFCEAVWQATSVREEAPAVSSLTRVCRLLCRGSQIR